MTREEAIKILRKEIECLSHSKCKDCILEKVCDPMITTPSDTEYIEAFAMAISALEKNESAEEWYKLLCEKWDSAENKGEWSRHTRVEPVYSIDGVKTWGDKCQCNKCTFTTIAVEGFGYYNFCPNCGADMRGE